jgi:hypothetical protein
MTHPLPPHCLQALLVDLLLKAVGTSSGLTPEAVMALARTALKDRSLPRAPSHPQEARTAVLVHYPGYHPDLTHVRALKALLKHRTRHGRYAAPVEQEVNSLVMSWLKEFGALCALQSLAPRMQCRLVGVCLDEASAIDGLCCNAGPCGGDCRAASAALNIGLRRRAGCCLLLVNHGLTQGRRFVLP